MAWLATAAAMTNSDEATPAKDARATQLVTRPTESLNVELKTWLDLGNDLHIAKLVRALFAIRNRNGGYLVLGFDDKTLQPDPYPFSQAVDAVYHHDDVQGVVSRYAHDGFEIEVRLGERDGQQFPVIVVPEGVRTPVAVKRDLIDQSTQKALLVKGDIFFRTLESNGTPSSARIAPADLPAIMEICFDNREADVGRFLRRQFGGDTPNIIRALLGGEPPPSAADQLRTRAEALIARGNAAAEAAYKALPLSESKLELVKGLTTRVGMVADPARADALPTGEFMNRVQAANPQYTGWPAWLDARGFHKEEDRARVQAGAWVTDLRGSDGGWGGERERLEFLLYDPRGEFYTRRLMQDDTADTVKPFVALDPVLMLYRVTEFIAAGISILRGLGWSEEDKAGFAFSWTGLAGRRVIPWANAMRFFGVGEGYESTTDEATSYVEVGLDTPHLSLAPAVERAAAPLFACFNGYQPDSLVVEEAVRALIERRL